MGRGTALLLMLVTLLAGGAGVTPAPFQRPPAARDSLRRTALPANVWAARDSIARMLAGVRDIKVSRSSGLLEDTFGRPHLACRLLVDGTRTLTGTGVVDRLRPWLESHGWTPDDECSADGPDGTFWGMQRDGVRCLIEGRWEGGDDSDSTYVPSLAYIAIIDCMVDVPDICPH